MDKKFEFWQQWLVYANIMFTIVGIVIVFFGESVLFHFWHLFSTDVFFDGDAEAYERIMPFRRFLFGIIGGTIAGFHLLMVYISKYSFKAKEKWAFNALLYGTVLWFVLDSSFSIYSGAFHNVWMINLVAMVGIGLPLWMTRKEFFRK